jgi:hypothetical protein
MDIRIAWWTAERSWRFVRELITIAANGIIF